MSTPIANTPLLPGSLKNLFFPPEKDEYTYFERTGAHPFASGNSVVKAAWAADTSMLAYARYGRDPMPPGDFNSNLARGGLTYRNEIGNWKAPGTQAYFATNDQFAFLAFRGTEVDDPIDKFDDADLALVYEPDYRPAPDHPGPALAHLSLVEHLFSIPCLVHQGFQRALNRVWDEVHSCVTDYRKAHPQAEVCFTGHSLGAALAVLAFSRFGDEGNSLITFGCPRVGDQAFRDRVLSNPGKGIFRYVNLNDSVAHVPLESYLYRHAPQECLRFDEGGSLDPDTGGFRGDAVALGVAVAGIHWDLNSDLSKIPAPAGLVDHSVARYCIRLWNCV
jgi:hypothetical protein